MIQFIQVINFLLGDSLLQCVWLSVNLDSLYHLKKDYGSCRSPFSYYLSSISSAVSSTLSATVSAASIASVCFSLISSSLSFADFVRSWVFWATDLRISFVESIAFFVISDPFS